MVYRVFGAALVILGVVMLFGAAGIGDLYVEEVKAGLVLPSGEDASFWDEFVLMVFGATMAGVGTLIYVVASAEKSDRGGS